MHTIGYLLFAIGCTRHRMAIAYYFKIRGRFDRVDLGLVGVTRVSVRDASLYIAKPEVSIVCH